MFVLVLPGKTRRHSCSSEAFYGVLRICSRYYSYIFPRTGHDLMKHFIAYHQALWYYCITLRRPWSSTVDHLLIARPPWWEAVRDLNNRRLSADPTQTTFVRDRAVFTASTRQLGARSYRSGIYLCPERFRSWGSVICPWCDNSGTFLRCSSWDPATRTRQSGNKPSTFTSTAVTLASQKKWEARAHQPSEVPGRYQIGRDLRHEF